MLPPDDLRQKCGDVMLVGGTFFLKGKLVLTNGTYFPVNVDVKISRRGITFPRVRLDMPQYKNNKANNK